MRGVARRKSHGRSLGLRGLADPRCESKLRCNSSDTTPPQWKDEEKNSQSAYSGARPIKICEVCEAEGVKNRYCRSCGVEMSRENMTWAALIGHAKPRAVRTKKQASKKLRSPSNMPAWLTEEFYLREIEPKLKAI